MDSEERDVFPGAVADWADEAVMAAHMSSYAREMEGVTTLCCVYGCALPCLHAVQANPTVASKFEAVSEEGELERGSGRSWV